MAALNAVMLIFAVPALFASLYVFRRRWRAASIPLRRVLAPVYLTAGATLVLLAVALVVSSISEDVSQVVFWALVFVFASVPIAFIVGLVRGRLARAGMGQLMLELGQAHEPGQLREALARALGDETLRLAYWIPETQSFADLDGNPIELPEPGGEELATMVGARRTGGGRAHPPPLARGRPAARGGGRRGRRARARERAAPRRARRGTGPEPGRCSTPSPTSSSGWTATASTSSTRARARTSRRRPST